MRLAIMAGLMALAVGSSGCAQRAGQPIRIEAESGQFAGVTAATTQPTAGGPSGSAYVTDFRRDGDQLVLEARTPGGFYEILVGYRSPSGAKGYGLSVGDLEFAGTFAKTGQEFAVHRVGVVELKAGTTPITLRKGWGYYDVDYVELVKTEPPRPPKTPKAVLSDAAADASARALMQYLTSVYGKFTLSGTYELPEAQYVYEITGKHPAILGGDLMDYSPTRLERGTRPDGTVETLLAAAKEGYLITLSWHWNAPAGLIDKELTDGEGRRIDARWWKGFNSNATTFDVAKAMADPESEEYRLILRDIDAIAPELRKLADAGVPVLWRPLHEAEGKWFWWGAKGPEATTRLWRLMHERLTRHHRLHNLIWVWNSIDPAWYPGDDVVDIVSLDAYPAPTDPLASSWNALQDRLAGRKLLAVAEFGGVPDVPRMHRYGVWWSYFVSWAGSEGPKKMAKDELKRIYSDPRVLSRAQMPRLAGKPARQ